MNNIRSSASGVSLIEMLVVVAIIGLVVSISIPSLASINRKRELKSAAAELRSIFRQTRSRAITTSRNSAVKFKLIDGTWNFAFFDDGDGDGVRNDDIAAGVDPMVAPFREVFGSTGRVRIGLPPTAVLDPDRGLVRPGDTPVRFNRSTLCSFSPVGAGTPGSIYLTDHVEHAAVVRVYGATGKVRLEMLGTPSGSAR